MRSERLSAAGDVLLLAPVRGLASEVGPLLAELAAFAPAVIGVGLSEGELASLRQYFVQAEADPIVPLTSTETSEVRGLARFGEVRVPNPAFVETLRWAEGGGLAVEALDPSDERTASLFTEHIGYVELVRRTVRERGMSRRPPTPSTPDEYALEWDRAVAGGRGSRDFARARDRHLARGAQRLGGGRSRVAIIVDRERFELVRNLLTGTVPEAIGDD
ncbi:MAG TPA: hypothetical protein VMC82_05095 [Thermoplasmata archaeon]|nr:hypothetical protein [Thermoplasmata archaeon]